MNGISDIRIIGLDPSRPPRVREEPYITLFFELTHNVPMDWCKAFNNLTSTASITARIEPAHGLFIESLVVRADDIENTLEALKIAVHKCNMAYMQHVKHSFSERNNIRIVQEEEGEQGRLNRIVAALSFDDE